MYTGILQKWSLLTYVITRNEVSSQTKRFEVEIGRENRALCATLVVKQFTHIQMGSMNPQLSTTYLIQYKQYD